jgi:hypothetical protein
MVNNLPPPSSSQPSNDQHGAGDDLASEQRERILGSGQTPDEKLPFPHDCAKLDATARQILANKGINTAPFPNTDQLVILFLKEHDVDARPPAGTASGDALSGAFFGAMGPAASFAGSHLRQQEKIAAMQEWTSWKQWAIGHADWPAFKDRLKQDYNANQALINEAVRSASFQADYSEYKLREKKEAGNNTALAILAAGLLVIASTVFNLLQNPIERRSTPELKNSTPESSNLQ